MTRDNSAFRTAFWVLLVSLGVSVLAVATGSGRRWMAATDAPLDDLTGEDLASDQPVAVAAAGSNASEPTLSQLERERTGASRFAEHTRHPLARPDWRDDSSIERNPHTSERNPHSGVESFPEVDGWSEDDGLNVAVPEAIDPPGPTAVPAPLDPGDFADADITGSHPTPPAELLAQVNPDQPAIDESPAVAIPEPFDPGLYEPEPFAATDDAESPDVAAFPEPQETDPPAAGPPAEVFPMQAGRDGTHFTPPRRTPRNMTTLAPQQTTPMGGPGHSHANRSPLVESQPAEPPSEDADALPEPEPQPATSDAGVLEPFEADSPLDSRPPYSPRPVAEVSTGGSKLTHLRAAGQKRQALQDHHESQPAAVHDTYSDTPAPSEQQAAVPTSSDLTEMRLEVRRLTELNLTQHMAELRNAQRMLTAYKSSREVEEIRQQLAQLIAHQQAEERRQREALGAVRVTVSQQDPNLWNVELLNASAGDALATLGAKAGWNLVTAPDVQGSVTAVLRNVSAEAAIERLLATHGWERVDNDGVVFIRLREGPNQTTARPTPVDVESVSPLAAPVPVAPALPLEAGPAPALELETSQKSLNRDDSDVVAVTVESDSFNLAPLPMDLEAPALGTDTPSETEDSVQTMAGVGQLANKTPGAPTENETIQYMPRYVAAQDLLPMIQPLLTRGSGEASAQKSAPWPGAEQTTEIIIVHDRAKVLKTVAYVLRSLDVYNNPNARQVQEPGYLNPWHTAGEIPVVIPELAGANPPPAPAALPELPSLDAAPLSLTARAAPPVAVADGWTARTEPSATVVSTPPDLLPNLPTLHAASLSTSFSVDQEQVQEQVQEQAVSVPDTAWSQPIQSQNDRQPAQEFSSQGAAWTGPAGMRTQRSYGMTTNWSQMNSARYSGATRTNVGQMGTGRTPSAPYWQQNYPPQGAIINSPVNGQMMPCPKCGQYHR